LTLETKELERLCRPLSGLDHLKRIRVHTRLPIAVPQRVDEEFLGWIKSLPQQVVFVFQINHPAEIDEPVTAMFAKLASHRIPLLSQSVLLKGINDRVEVLAQLCEKLADRGVIPYYLHQLDRVAGASHFEVPIHKGIALIEKLRALLPGYAVPRYVQEVPGRPGKVVLA